MKKRNIAFASLALLIPVLLSANANAFRGNGQEEGRGQGLGQTLTTEERAERQTQREERQSEMETQRDAMDTAIENGDFDTWKSLHTEKYDEMTERFENSDLADDKKSERLEKMTERHTTMLANLTEANFTKVQEMHSLMNQVKELREEMKDTGFGFGGEMRMGRNKGQKRGGMNRGGRGNFGGERTEQE